MNFVPKKLNPLICCAILALTNYSGYALTLQPLEEPPPPPGVPPPGVPVDESIVLLVIASIALGWYYLNANNKKARV